MRFFFCLLLTGLAVSTAVQAGEADVVDARAYETSPGVWRFEATVRHADEGWEHYADYWEVVSSDGAVLGRRELAHPHVNEQPFTRSLSGVRIPASVAVVTIRAHDSVHGYGGAEFELALVRAGG